MIRRAILFGLAAVLALAPSLPAATASAGGETDAAGCYCVGTVGNVNCDYKDEVTLADISLLIDHLFITGRRLPNLNEANIDGDPERIISLGDISMLIDHIFISGVELPLCPQPYNSPPVTSIVGFVAGVPFINAAAPGSPVTGVRMSWTAEDRVDHPYDDPDFEFEYRMYGPYSDSLLDIVNDSFILDVFITNDGTIHRYLQDPPDTFVVCDTFWMPGGIPEIQCETVLVDTIQETSIYGRLDTLLDFESPAFLANPDLNRTCAVSGDGGDVWTVDTRDSLYNLFADYPSDTTVEANYIFWVRARDPVDSTVYDPTPARRAMEVINPLFERGVLVINWTGSANENKALEDSAKAYWSRAVDIWATNSGLGGVVEYDVERDFQHAAHYTQNNLMLRHALKYKLLVIIQDAEVPGVWSNQGQAVRGVMTAAEVGANVWVATRVPLGYHSAGSAPSLESASPAYQYCFGIQQYVFPGWSAGFFNASDGYGFGLPRVEDFIGATSQSPGNWPDLAVDTAFLHHRYLWQGSLDPPIFPFYPFMSEFGALPQVGWIVPTEDAEVMYRYVSRYGEEEHPYVPSHDYHDLPVMVRVDRGRFRTVQSLFTPLVLEETTGQQMVDSVLSWLYEKWLPEGASAPFEFGRNQ